MTFIFFNRPLTYLYTICITEVCSPVIISSEFTSTIVCAGLIQAGDEVHEVNGEKVTGRPPEEVVRILTGAVGPVTLKLVPGDMDLSFCSESKVR